MSTFIKAEKVVATALGLLTREIVLPALVWRDAVGDFAGAKGDTISIRVPAYTNANKRALRSGAVRTKTVLAENKVDVSLTTDIYLDVPVSDEELSLDIADFGGQVLNPVVQAIARELEDELAATMSGAIYQTTLAHAAGTDDPYETAVAARAALNDARVPMAGRALAVGSDLEQEFLLSDRLLKDLQGSNESTLRDSTIGRIAGFDVVSVPGLAPGQAFAFHKTAYVLSNRAPVVPAGAPWGATGNYGGAAIRTVRVFDPNEVEDRFVADSWVGSNVVKDKGHMDAVTGAFVPAEGQVADNADPTLPATDAPRLVRAVKINVA